MRVLHCVEFYHPSKGGAQEVVRQISERLAREGHDVTVATSWLPERTFTELNRVKIRQFKASGNLTFGLQGEINEFREYVLSQGFDVVMCYAAQQWTTDALLDILPRLPSLKVFVPCGFSGLYRAEFRDYFEKMKGWIRAFDASVYLSNSYRDIDFARQHGARNITIIPNGAAEEEFLREPAADFRKKLGVPENHFLLLHVGSHTGAKGHEDAMRILMASEIREATLLVVGNGFQDGCARRCHWQAFWHNLSARIAGRGISIRNLELDREMTVLAYLAADLFLFPSNIECSPIVLFEAMASKTPFLTTDVGNASEIVEWSRGGQILPTVTDKSGQAHAIIDESAAKLRELKDDTKQLKQLSESGYKAWQERFTWQKIAEQYLKLYQQTNQ